jgi:hypothetical protein
LADDTKEGTSIPVLAFATFGATVTILTGVLGAVGISSGLLLGLLRNNTGLILIVWTIVILGVILGIASGVVAKATDSVRRVQPGVRDNQQSAQSLAPKSHLASLILSGISVILVFGGMMVLLNASAKALTTTNRPTISLNALPSASGGTAEVNATVTAAGLTTDERYYIEVWLFNRAPERTRKIFYTYAGASAEGALSYALKVSVPYDPEMHQLAITAQLQSEHDVFFVPDTCGLPKARPLISPTVTPSSAVAPSMPSPSIAASATQAAIRPPAAGTTCAVVDLIEVKATGTPTPS